MELLKPGQSVKPRVTESEVRKLLQLKYGINSAQVTQLLSYDDLNYHVEVESIIENPYIPEVWEQGYVFKVMNSHDSKNSDFVEGQHKLLLFLDKKGVPVPVPVKSMNGQSFSTEFFEESSGNIIQLLLFRPGKTLASIESSPELYNSVGEFVGKLTTLIKGFWHPGLETKQSIWKLESVLSIRAFLYVITDIERVRLVTDILQEFEDKVLSHSQIFERGTIHGDVNDHNIIVTENKVSALIDFGDCHYSLLVFELAISICYILIHSNQMESPQYILNGYQRHRELDINERNILKTCVCARLCQSLVLGLYSYSQDPSNTYLLSTQQSGWKMLLELYNWKEDDIKTKWHL